MMSVPISEKATVTLPAEDQILIRREFDAPRHLVFKAFTTPELVRRWWHAKRGEMQACEIDLRVGGRWRYAMTTPDGMEVAFNGEYREIVPDERVVSTETFEAAPAGDPAVNTATFTDAGDGRTVLEILVQAPSREVRDAIIESGMEDGLQDALALLEETAKSAA